MTFVLLFLPFLLGICYTLESGLQVLHQTQLSIPRDQPHLVTWTTSSTANPPSSSETSFLVSLGL